MRRFLVWGVLAVAVLVLSLVTFGALAQVVPSPVAPPEAPIDDLGAGIVSVLTDLILTKVNVSLMAAAWVLIQTARRLLPDALFKSQAWVRLEPVLGIVLCSIGVWLPGLHTAGSSVADTVLLGIILGFVVGQTHKIGLQSVLGKDSRLESEAKPAVTGTDVTKPGA